MSDTYSYEVLEPGGHARLVGNVLDRISKASANPASAVGSSRAMLGDPETASWMERTTAADGAALIDAIYGNTLRLNQLLDLENRTVTDHGVNMVASNGKMTLSGTADGQASIRLNSVSVPVKVTAGHKFVAIATARSTGIYFSVDGIGSLYSDAVYTASSGGNRLAYLIVPAGTNTSLTIYPQIFDLTQMFGAGNEPATVAEFEALFPLPYYPYDAGSLLPVRMEGVETVAADESWSSQRTIPAATYFPQGMRSAGSVYDELRADAAVTRVGERAYQSGDESDASVITDGTVTHYSLATPTITPIDPPLPLSYRVGAGGTERVMVASGTTSAPPIFVTRYPLDPADLAASIAPRESVTAEANHAVGDLVMLGWTLCKVTTAIARGEAITIGTNVTKTSVAAEIAALS